MGVGAVAPGDAFISLGTSGVIFVVNDALQADPDSGVHAFCHALPGRWHQMSVMLSAASCLRWICNLLSVTESQLMDEIAQLTDEELKRAPVFLPYLSGSARRITIRWQQEVSSICAMKPAARCWGMR